MTSVPFVVELPWPCAALSLNSREHRKAKAEATARYRHACKVATMAAAKGRKVEHPDAVFTLDLEFRPPHKRGYDDDGLVSRAKGLRDGLADALGINDNQFRIGKVTIGEVQAWGAVIASVTEAHETRPAAAVLDDGGTAAGHTQKEQ